MALTPTQKIALCVADLERCDDLLTSLWHEDSRREVQARRKALLKICIQEADQISMEFTYPGEPCHPRFAKL